MKDKTGIEKRKSTLSVKLNGVHIDNKLSFNNHINKISKSAGNKPNRITQRS